MSFIAVAVILAWVMITILTILMLLLYRQFGLLYLGSGRRVHLSGIAVGRHAPSHQTVVLNGADGELNWAAAGPGRGTLLIFGGPQCPFCEELIPQLNEAVRRWGGLIDIIFVDRPLQKDGPAGRDLPGDREWSYAYSADAAVYEAFDVAVSPYGFVVSAEGIVLNKRIVDSLHHIAMLVEGSIDKDTGAMNRLRRDQPLKLINKSRAIDHAVEFPDEGHAGHGKVVTDTANSIHRAR